MAMGIIRPHNKVKRDMLTVRVNWLRYRLAPKPVRHRSGKGTPQPHPTPPHGGNGVSQSTLACSSRTKNWRVQRNKPSP